jgi:polar amino acid transport system substrate-binding protein
MAFKIPKLLTRVAAAAVILSALSMTGAQAEESQSYWQGVKKAGVLRCGAAVYAPFVMRDPASGAYTGFFADLCRQFADVLKVKPVFVDTTWDNIVAGLQAGKWDLSLALNRTPERAMAVGFSIPAVQYEISLAYNKSNPKVGTNPASIQDIDTPEITIALTSGTVQDRLLTGVLKNAKLLRLPSEDEARLAVISRRADFIAGGSDANQFFIQANPDWATSFNPNPALTKQGVAFGLPHQMSAQDVAVVNIFLEEKVATGEVDALVHKAVDEVLAAQK